MLTNFDETIIPYYSPISSRGGRRRKSRKHRTRKHKNLKNRRTRRRYH